MDPWAFEGFRVFGFSIPGLTYRMPGRERASRYLRAREREREREKKKKLGGQLAGGFNRPRVPWGRRLERASRYCRELYTGCESPGCKSIPVLCGGYYKIIVLCRRALGGALGPILKPRH